MKTRAERLDYIKAWKKRNPDKCRAYARTQYWNHRPRRLERMRAQHVRNRDRRLVKKRNRYAENRERLCAESKAYRKAHPEFVTKHRRLNKKRQRDSSRRRDHRMTVRLTDGVVRKYLKRAGIKQPTQNQIQLCRQRIQTRRAAKAFRLLHAAALLSNLLPT